VTGLFLPVLATFGAGAAALWVKREPAARPCRDLGEFLFQHGHKFGVAVLTLTTGLLLILLAISPETFHG
jgi:hypothetical protein